MTGEIKGKLKVWRRIRADLAICLGFFSKIGDFDERFSFSFLSIVLFLLEGRIESFMVIKDFAMFFSLCVVIVDCETLIWILKRGILSLRGVFLFSLLNGNVRGVSCVRMSLAV